MPFCYYWKRHLLHKFITSCKLLIYLIFVILVPLSCTGHPCVNGATCVESADSYHCKCTAGYKGLKCSGKVNENNDITSVNVDVLFF